MRDARSLPERRPMASISGGPWRSPAPARAAYGGRGNSLAAPKRLPKQSGKGRSGLENPIARPLRHSAVQARDIAKREVGDRAPPPRRPSVSSWAGGGAASRAV